MNHSGRECVTAGNKARLSYCAIKATFLILILDLQAAFVWNQTALPLNNWATALWGPLVTESAESDRVCCKNYTVQLSLSCPESSCVLTVCMFTGQWLMPKNNQIITNIVKHMSNLTALCLTTQQKECHQWFYCYTCYFYWSFQDLFFKSVSLESCYNFDLTINH